VSLQWHLRFEFVTGITENLYESNVNGDGNFLQYQGLESVPVDTFDCLIPVRVFGIQTGVRKGKKLSIELS
jgi:hypothetical protein